jgi:uncharacterized protein
MDSSLLDQNINWKKLHSYVKTNLKDDKTGHDYEHTKRVLMIALEIAENCSWVDYDVLVASCLLHDIAYREGVVKNHHLKGAEDSESILRFLGFNELKIKKIKDAIEDHGCHIGKPVRKNEELQIESKILRDSDNIDALGAIGLARQISFCASQGIPIFKSKEDIFNQSMYGGVKEIITWADKMLTVSGKKIAEKRVQIMKDFLRQIEEEFI